MSRFVVAADAAGVPTVRIPLHLAWNFVKYFPANKIVTRFHHETNRLVVMFPGWNAPMVQKIMDDLDGDTATGREHFASWPSLRADRGREADSLSDLIRPPENAVCKQDNVSSMTPHENRFANEEFRAFSIQL